MLHFDLYHVTTLPSETNLLLSDTKENDDCFGPF